MEEVVSITHVLGAAESDTSDARDTGQAQLLEGLASLLLVAVVDHGGRAGREAALNLLDIGIVAAVVLDLDDLLGLLVGELFNSRVGHFCCWCGCRC